MSMIKENDATSGRSDACEPGMAVAFCVNERFATPLAVALYSLLEHLQPASSLVIYVFSSDLSEESQQGLNRIVSDFPQLNVILKVVHPDLSCLQNLPVNFRFTADNYTRLLLDRLIPEGCDRILYLDCDVLIAADISKLWSVPIEPWHALAGRDMAIPVVSSLLGLRNFDKIGLRPDTPYFNSGVLMINLKKWLQDSITEACLQYTTSHSEYIRWADQDSLNAVLAGKWGMLDVEWNFAPAFLGKILKDPTWPDHAVYAERAEELRGSAAIYHYAGTSKPWNSYMAGMGYDMWTNTLYRSGWLSKSQRKGWPANVAWQSAKMFVTATNERRRALYYEWRQSRR